MDILNIGVNDRSSKSVFRFTCTIHPIISPPLSICFRHTKSADKCQIRSRKNNSCICKLVDINLFTCGTNINTLCFNDQVDWRPGLYIVWINPRICNGTLIYIRVDPAIWGPVVWQRQIISDFKRIYIQWLRKELWQKSIIYTLFYIETEMQESCKGSQVWIKTGDQELQNNCVNQHKISCYVSLISHLIIYLKKEYVSMLFAPHPHHGFLR